MTLKIRTDMAPAKKLDLSAESIHEMFNDIRKSIGLESKPLIELRTARRKELEANGFPFASEDDYNGI